MKIFKLIEGLKVPVKLPKQRKTKAAKEQYPSIEVIWDRSTTDYSCTSGSSRLRTYEVNTSRQTESLNEIFGDIWRDARGRLNR
jgi:hypothetical protein